MKRKATAVLLFVLFGCAGWTAYCVHSLLSDNEYYIAHIPRHHRAGRLPITEIHTGREPRSGSRHRIMTSEQIAASAKGYLVKIRIFKEITIPITQQKIYTDTHSFGSGSIVSCKKYRYCVLTAFHVVDDSSMTYFAETEDGSPAQMLRLVKGTTYFDTAVLRFADTDHEPAAVAPIGRSSLLVRGSPVYTMGSNRFGDFWFSGGGTLVTDVRRADANLQRILASINEDHPELLLFLTPIYAGYSGGPVLNKYGELVGINIAYAGIEHENIYIGSPIDDIRKALKILR